MSNEGMNLYKSYQKNKDEILILAKEQASIIKDLNLDEIQSEGTKKGEIINGLINRLQSDTLSVLVLGRFSSGKSTFINALFGQAILPASPTPTTGVLCEVMYADDKEKKAVLFPKPGVGDNSENSPFEVPISNINSELKKYVVIDNSGTSNITSRFKKLELYYPLSLCKNNVKIIDSIGLDDPESREKETLEYLPFVDAIIYCMKSQDTYSAVDKKVLNLLKSCKYESIFFVITRYDEIRESVRFGEMISEDYFKNIQYKNLAPWTELGEAGIMFVDSRSALFGKMSNDKNLVDSSEICKVETSLESFLVQEKGKKKLLNALHTLKDTNLSARKAIQSRILMLQADIEVLEERYKNAELPLKSLEVQRQLMIQKVDSKIFDIARTAKDMTYSYSLELTPKIKKWSSEYEIKSSIGFPPTKKKLEPVVTEVVNYLKDMIEDDIVSWSESTLSPMVESGVEEMKNSLEDQARYFVTSVELLRVQISIGEQLNNEEIAKQKEASLAGKLIAGGYTLFTGDFITGGVGMFLGIKAMLSTLVLELLSAVMLLFLGLLNPLTLALAVIGSIVAGNFFNLLSLKDGIKKTVGDKFIEEIGNHSNEICENVENKVTDSLSHIRESLDSGLAGEISSIRDEVEKVLEERTKGKLNIEEETKKLRDLEHRNIFIEEKIDELLRKADFTEKNVNPPTPQIATLF